MIVQTRARPQRDLELIDRYAVTTTPSDGGPSVVVSYSIVTDRDDLIRRFERTTPLFGERMAAITALRGRGIWVVRTLNPFGLWNDLPGTLERLRDLDVAYVTHLFLKRGESSASTPRRFIDYVAADPDLRRLLNPAWQRAQANFMHAEMGAGRVLEGKPAFASLAAPHRVLV